jgi:rhodanese-related sulfurtransferase
MGWKDVFVLAEAGQEISTPDPAIGACDESGAVDASSVLAFDDVSVVDLSRSPDYARAHIPGAWFAVRSRLDRALVQIAPTGEVVLTSEDGRLACLAAAEARHMTDRPVHWLKGGNAAWASAGFPLSTSPRMADEPDDVWLKPYERSGDTQAAMNAYLSWEVDLLERIAQDGTTRFLRGSGLPASG